MLQDVTFLGSKIEEEGKEFKADVQVARGPFFIQKKKRVVEARGGRRGGAVYDERTKNGKRKEER
jgi:hypothetical protein